MISVHFSDSPVIDFESAQKADGPEFKKFFHGMLENGIYLPPSSYESWFIGNAISDDDVKKTLTIAEKITASW